MSVQLILDRLKNNRFERYIVGGYVRDKLLGIKSYDVDIVTNARPDEIKEIFSDRSLKSVGETFKVMMVDNIEVATYRKDRYFGGGDKDVEITYADTLEEDLERRDLTINSMALDPSTDKIIDLFNGREDLERGIIRLVGDPEERLFEDTNRIVRACRFQAKIQGIFDPYTFQAMMKFTNSSFELIAKERIKEELMKAMKIKKASIFFRSLYALGMLAHIFPALNKCHDMEHGKYHKEDVFQHNMLAGDCISTKYPLLKLTAYVHDCGKSECYQDTPEGRSFIQHEYVGCDILKEELKNLTFSNNEIKYVTNLVRYHMRGIKQSGPRAIRRLLKKLEEHNLDYRDLLKIKIADRIANLNKNHYSFGDIRGFLLKYRKEINREAELSFMKLKISGNDIMELLGLKPGKEVGRIKKELEGLVLDKPDKNNREYLLELLEEYKK